MKKYIQKLTVAAAIIVASVSSIPEVKAASMKLDGSGYYILKPYTAYYPYGAAQTGRYANRSLGAGYYRNIVIGIDFITNRSTVPSGSLSWEFWAMPYYEATSGIILATHGVRAFRPGESVPNMTKVGMSVLLDARRFPEQNLWEYTVNGWRFRDALRFTTKKLL